MQLLFDVLVEVDAERSDAQGQKNNADNEIYRFENVAHHSQRTLISALRLLSDSSTVAASSCMPASVIADPLYADSENNHHYRSEGNPKDR
jgi:hypothetical protein